VTTRWPDSRTAFWKPGLKNGVRRREVYEDRGARISILAGRRPPRPDTLKQTDQRPIPTRPLADGAGHTFFKCLDDRSSCRRAVRTRGHSPTDEAAIKLPYLFLRQVAQTWKMPPREWCEAKTQFAIMFDDRFVKA
jgi:hypothetical protein